MEMAELEDFRIAGAHSAFLMLPVQKASNLKAGKLCKEESLCRGSIYRSYSQRPVATKLKF